MKKTFQTSYFILLILFIFVISTIAFAQDKLPKTVKCPTCHHVNKWDNEFCYNCGQSLSAAKAHILEEIKQAEKEKEASKNTPAIKVYEGPVDPQRLFLIPTADVLGSLEMSIGGGSIIGEMKEEKRPFLGRICLGLGGVAEIEASTVGIVSGLSKGSAAIPTAAFKLKFLPEMKRFPYVGLAGALRSSLWHSELRDSVNFEKRVSTLYFVASKTFRNVSVHVGLSISDLRLRTKYSHNDILLSPTPEQAEKEDKDYVNKNIFSPLVGVKAVINPRTYLMIEFAYLPEYKFTEKNPVVDRAKIDAIWMTIAGVRFFIFDWLPLDAGVLYRGDYHGIGDMHIQAGLNINLPLPRIARALRKK